MNLREKVKAFKGLLIAGADATDDFLQLIEKMEGHTRNILDIAEQMKKPEEEKGDEPKDEKGE